MAQNTKTKNREIQTIKINTRGTSMHSWNTNTEAHDIPRIFTQHRESKIWACCKRYRQQEAHGSGGTREQPLHSHPHHGPSPGASRPQGTRSGHDDAQPHDYGQGGHGQGWSDKQCKRRKDVHAVCVLIPYSDSTKPTQKWNAKSKESTKGTTKERRGGVRRGVMYPFELHSSP